MKFMGAKTRICKYIIPIIQKEIDDNNIDTFVDVFCGGANVVDKIKCKHRIAFDKDRFLIALLRHVQAGLPLLEEVPKPLYDKAREEWYKDNRDVLFGDWEIGCICYLASVNGRDFSAGYAKDGTEPLSNGRTRTRHYYKEAKKNLLSQAKKDDFHGIDFRVSDYRDLDFTNSLMYLDPPYFQTKQYANSKHFDYEEFWDVVRKWSKDNIVIVSELQAPDDFECIWEKDVSRSIKAKSKSRAVEKLFKWRG